MKTVVFAGTLLAVLCSTSAIAQTDGGSSNDRFVVVQAKIDQVMKAKSATETFQECMKSNSCTAILENIVGYFNGIHSGEVTPAEARIRRMERKGEEGWYSFGLPDGYAYCHSRIDPVSMVPREGKRASLLTAASDAQGISAYTWTPKLRLGDGKSWMEANFTIVGVKSDQAEKEYAAGTCKRPGNQLINCRGNGEGDRAACGTVTDK